METEVAGKSTVDDVTRKEVMDKAAAVMAQGKRNVVCGEIPTAVNQFQEACKILAKTFGETSKECAEAYFCYGQALLDLARMETGVLGNALEGVPEEEEEEEEKKDDKENEQFENPDKIKGEEREQLRQEVYDAMAEPEKVKDENKNSEKVSDMNGGETEVGGDTEAGSNEKMDCENSETSQKEMVNDTDKASSTEASDEKKVSTDVSDVNKTESDEKTDEKVKEEKKTDEKDAEESGKTEEEKENGDEEEEGEGTEEEGEEDEALDGEDTADDEKKEGEEDPDDVPNLQLAWEMLELAKVIYLKDDDKVAQLKAAQSYLKLGEVGLETEQYEQAIGDLNECLKIQKKILESDDRLLAETYYQLGLAYSLDKQYEPAINSYKGAIDVIESRMVNLKKIMEEKPSEEKKSENDKPTDSSESVGSPEQELKELNELLPDIKAKIEDTEEEQKNLDQLKSMAKEIAGNAFEQLGNKPGESSTGFSSSTESSKETTAPSDITHLVRKKRKPEDDIPDEAGDCKKSKQEIEQNGHVNGTNGTTEESEEKPMEITEKKVEDVTAPVEATS